MPPQVVSILALDGGYFEEVSQSRALARAKHEGFLDAIPVMAQKALAALAPVEHQPLIDRLTMLGMSMANGRSDAQVHAWLHETARMLSDLPQHVLFDAIDQCVKEPGRVFVPSVGEIREKASARLAKEERRAARLAGYAKLIAEGVEIPEWVAPPPPMWGDPQPEPEPNCTPEEAAAILKEYGLPSSYGQKLASYLNPERSRTRAELLADGICPPPINPEKPDPYAIMA